MEHLQKPMFEYITEEHHYKIFENGTIDGFPDKGGRIINRIQAKILTDFAIAWNQMHDLSPSIKANEDLSGSSQETPE